MMLFMLVLFFVVKIWEVNTANILGIMTTASYSHQIPFQPLWRELALRGHQVTVITTDPQKNASVKNLREIDISHLYKIYEEYQILHIHCASNMSLVDKSNLLAKAFYQAQEYQLRHPQVKELIANKAVKFDLVIAEAQAPIMMSFAWRFKCPLIAVSSMDAAMIYHDAVGNIVHPVLNPDMNLDIMDPENMSFQDRIKSFLYNVFYRLYVYQNLFPRNDKQAKNYFGDDLPSLYEIQNNISALFVTTNPITHTMRPATINTISLGAGHIVKQPKHLPKPVKDFIESTEDGIIYFCLGSNILGSILDDKFMDTVLETFAELPYKVLLKLDYQPKNIPNNVMIQKWMPQQDILRHPNVKLFITHGGLQSLQEGIYYGKPVIGIPICGDAFSNVNKMVSMGYGKRLDLKTITKQLLKNTVIEMIENKSYHDRAQQIMKIFQDEEIPALQRAVFWTEYIIRHKGAQHLKSPLVTMPVWKYHMLDIIGSLIVLFVVVTIIMFKTFKIILDNILLFGIVTVFVSYAMQGSIFKSICFSIGVAGVLYLLIVITKLTSSVFFYFITNFLSRKRR